MGQYEIHAFVCTHGPTCPTDGDAVGVQKTLKRLVAQHGLADRIRINQGGCLNQCGHGPMMVVYPQNVWYHHLTPQKAEQIFQEHFLGGVPAERFVYRNPPGKHKVPRDAEGRFLPCPCPNHELD